MNGVLIVNKPMNCTSHDVVNSLRKLLNTKKIGHTGTLDPIATGVLVVCIGKYTKLASLISSEDKEYIACFKLGIETDTGDITGNVIKTDDNYYLNEPVIRRIINKFPKKYLQEVPIYSAVKIKGKKLYEYARNNEEVVLPKREVEIKELELLNIDDNIIRIRCVVSKGTYVRSLIKDIATKLKTIATMTGLNRIRQGNFLLDNSFTLEDVKNSKYKFTLLEQIFQDYEIREIDGEYLTKIKNGMLIPYDFDKNVLFKYKKEYIAIYTQYEKDPLLAKPKVMF